VHSIFERVTDIKKTTGIAAGGSVVFPPQENSNQMAFASLFASCAA
jgi:DNA polymerase III alpha subunit (gram-positive type)